MLSSGAHSCPGPPGRAHPPSTRPHRDSPGGSAASPQPPPPSTPLRCPKDLSPRALPGLKARLSHREPQPGPGTASPRRSERTGCTERWQQGMGANTVLRLGRTTYRVPAGLPRREIKALGKAAVLSCHSAAGLAALWSPGYNAPNMRLQCWLFHGFFSLSEKVRRWALHRTRQPAGARQLGPVCAARSLAPERPQLVLRHQGHIARLLQGARWPCVDFSPLHFYLLQDLRVSVHISIASDIHTPLLYLFSQ